MENHAQPLAQGVSVTSAGQANVSQQAADAIFDIALTLEPESPYPVDVQHVLAAIVLASRNDQILPTDVISSTDAALLETLKPHIETVFQQYGGRTGADD